MRKSNLHNFLKLIIVIPILFFACDRYDDHPVPSARVNFMINLNTDPEFIRLGAIGNAQEIFAVTLGLSYLGYDNNGILIYNAGGEFYAFDMTCPYEMPGESVAVEIYQDISSGMAICPVCSTTYILPSEGAPSTDSKGKWPLKEYRTYYYPTSGDLQVSN